MSEVTIRKYKSGDLPEMIAVWNEVVEGGVAFPQEEMLDSVVRTNIHARHLYERVGFKQLGTIPGGFRMKDGSYEDICPYYIEV